jgi:hypothetical protein
VLLLTRCFKLYDNLLLILASGLNFRCSKLARCCFNAGTGDLMDKLAAVLPPPPSLADAAGLLAEEEPLSRE